MRGRAVRSPQATYNRVEPFQAAPPRSYTPTLEQEPQPKHTRGEVTRDASPLYTRTVQSPKSDYKYVGSTMRGGEPEELVPSAERDPSLYSTYKTYSVAGRNNLQNRLLQVFIYIYIYIYVYR